MIKGRVVESVDVYCIALITFHPFSLLFSFDIVTTTTTKTSSKYRSSCECFYLTLIEKRLGFCSSRVQVNFRYDFLDSERNNNDDDDDDYKFVTGQ